MTISRFSFPTLIHFGPGARRELPAWLAAQGVKRPLVVTDKGLGGLPVFAELLDLLRASSAPAAYADVAGNPVKGQVTRGVEAFRAHRADGIVGVGGGAALDVAKAIALMVHHPGDLFEYEDGRKDARPIEG
ncbi:MAG TPA: iron-containing alcohol dehydrogenase, partial [Vicinamibacteria bacterium]|nr:iron-containing alcohol dehydrogenase [Vicinamibacteria bacterium]